MDPYYFTRFFCSSKDFQSMDFRKSYAGKVLEKVGILAMEISSIPSIFYIIGVKAYNRLLIS